MCRPPTWRLPAPPKSSSPILHQAADHPPPWHSPSTDPLPLLQTGAPPFSRSLREGGDFDFYPGNNLKSAPHLPLPLDFARSGNPNCRKRGPKIRDHSQAIMARPMPLAPNTKLGPYEIQSPLGAGGMGEVYRANDTRLDRTVAVKILPSHLSENSE